MVQTIGIMIGAYILVRMVSFVTRGGQLKEHHLVRVLSVANILLTLILIGVLLTAGFEAPK